VTSLCTLLSVLAFVQILFLGNISIKVNIKSEYLIKPIKN
jgi:hypothetical protein